MDREQTLSFNDQNIAQFRASGGRIDSFGDAPVLLLSTIGAKSGIRRTSPMMYLADERDSDRIFVFASAAGADSNPAWYHNLIAHPDRVTVEIGVETMSATAHVLPEDERAQTYAIQAGRYPGFADYQTKTERLIPVFALNLRR